MPPLNSVWNIITYFFPRHSTYRESEFGWGLSQNKGNTAMADNWPNKIKAYALAVVLVGLGVALRLVLPPLQDRQTPYLTIYPAIILAAILFGKGPALVAASLGYLVVESFFLESGGRSHSVANVLLSFSVIAGSALFLGYLGDRFREIRARITAEADVARAAEQRLRALLDASLSGIAVTENDRLVDANDQLGCMLGYTRDELIGMEAWQLVPAEDLPRVIENIHKGHEMVIDHEMVCKDGSHIHVEAHGKTIELQGRRVRFTSLHDITERKRVEKALRESEQRFRIMGETVPYGVWWCNEHGGTEYVSQSFLDLLQMTMDEMREFGWTKRMPSDQVELHLRRWLHCVQTGEDWDNEYQVLGPDGKYHTILTRGKPVRNSEGKIIGWVGINLDIDRRKRAEEQLAAAKQAAESASKAKDHFLAVLSHELRTPLTPVLGTVSLLQNEPHLDAEILENLEMIRRNVELEARLIDDLLDLTRIARGKVELSKRRVELGRVIGQTVEVCRPELEAQRLDFSVDIGPEAPYWIEADPARIQQVFWNLLKNAIKFTPPGGCVGIRCRRENGHVLVEVNDSGEGIEPEALTRIFNAFEQGEPSITRRFGGLGLGLAISKALMDLHGGTIEAHSEGKGKGATFRLRLPLVQPAAQPISPTSPADTGPVAASAPQTFKVLLVEDHHDTAKIICRLLERKGHLVHTAVDVATALELVGQHSFDLMISDLGLPDRSGLDLMRTLRADGHQFPAIALSGYGQEEDINNSREAGFNVHVVKPDFEQLFRAINAVLQ